MNRTKTTLHNYERKEEEEKKSYYNKGYSYLVTHPSTVCAKQDLKVLANVDTLLLMTFPCARKLGNICCGHKMFLNKIRNIFVSRAQNLCPQQMLRARVNRETFVSATMCPQQCVLVCQYLNFAEQTKHVAVLVVY